MKSEQQKIWEAYEDAKFPTHDGFNDEPAVVKVTLSQLAGMAIDSLTDQIKDVLVGRFSADGKFNDVDVSEEAEFAIGQANLLIRILKAITSKEVSTIKRLLRGGDGVFMLPGEVIEQIEDADRNDQTVSLKVYDFAGSTRYFTVPGEDIAL